MSTEKLAALRDGSWTEFNRKSSPKCPHCGEDYSIQKMESWSLYSDDDLHDVECPNCENEFTVTTTCSYTFSTDEQEDL